MDLVARDGEMVFDCNHHLLPGAIIAVDPRTPVGDWTHPSVFCGRRLQASGDRLPAAAPDDHRQHESACLSPPLLDSRYFGFVHIIGTDEVWTNQKHKYVSRRYRGPDL